MSTSTLSTFLLLIVFSSLFCLDAINAQTLANCRTGSSTAGGFASCDVNGIGPGITAAQFTSSHTQFASAYPNYDTTSTTCQFFEYYQSSSQGTVAPNITACVARLNSATISRGGTYGNPSFSVSGQMDHSYFELSTAFSSNTVRGAYIRFQDKGSASRAISLNISLFFVLIWGIVIAGLY